MYFRCSYTEYRVIDDGLNIDSGRPIDHKESAKLCTAYILNYKKEEQIMKQKPIIGITMGDPAGIGPEITIKALAGSEIYDKVRPWLLEM